MSDPRATPSDRTESPATRLDPRPWSRPFAAGKTSELIEWGKKYFTDRVAPLYAEHRCTADCDLHTMHIRYAPLRVDPSRVHVCVVCGDLACDAPPWIHSADHLLLQRGKRVDMGMGVYACSGSRCLHVCGTDGGCDTVTNEESQLVCACTGMVLGFDPRGYVAGWKAEARKSGMHISTDGVTRSDKLTKRQREEVAEREGEAYEDRTVYRGLEFRVGTRRGDGDGDDHHHRRGGSGNRRRRGRKGPASGIVERGEIRLAPMARRSRVWCDLGEGDALGSAAAAEERPVPRFALVAHGDEAVCRRLVYLYEVIQLIREAGADAVRVANSFPTEVVEACRVHRRELDNQAALVLVEIFPHAEAVAATREHKLLRDMGSVAAACRNLLRTPGKPLAIDRLRQDLMRVAGAHALPVRRFPLSGELGSEGQQMVLDTVRRSSDQMAQRNVAQECGEKIVDLLMRLLLHTRYQERTTDFPSFVVAAAYLMRDSYVEDEVVLVERHLVLTDMLPMASILGTICAQSRHWDGVRRSRLQLTHLKHQIRDSLLAAIREETRDPRSLTRLPNILRSRS